MNIHTSWKTNLSYQTTSLLRPLWLGTNGGLNSKVLLQLYNRLYVISICHITIHSTSMIFQEARYDTLMAEWVPFQAFQRAIRLLAFLLWAGVHLHIQVSLQVNTQVAWNQTSASSRYRATENTRLFDKKKREW